MRSIPWKGALAVAATAFMLSTVARAVTAQPSTSPNAADVRNAARVEAPRRGQRDDRDALPHGELVAGNGVVEPADRETRVAASVAGRIARIAVREGQRVRSGEILAELDGAAERAALAAAEADVSVSEAELARARRGTRAEDLDATRAETEAARARAALSAEVLARTERLAGTGDATGDELSRARRQAEVDAASMRQADARGRAAVNGTRREDLQVAVARLRAAQARRDQARAVAERLVVRAPIDAEVLFVKYRIGEYYAPNGEALMILGDTRALRARIDVDEREIARIRLNGDGFVTADAFPGRRVAGRVVEIARRFGRRNVRTDDPAERIDTKVLEVVLALSDAAGLVPGQRVIGYVAR